MATTAHGRENYVIGADYGALSGCAVVVRVRDGKERGSGVFDYPHAVITEALPFDVPDMADGRAVRLSGGWALRVPNDYGDALPNAVPAAIADAGIDSAPVVGIATDFTACSMVPVKADGTPLNELDGFANWPHAYVRLWGHHAVQPQAKRINKLAAERGEDWLPPYGELISPEWEFAKALQLPEEDPEAYAEIDHWIEAADWIVWQRWGLFVRNACTAGYKGIYELQEVPGMCGVVDGGIADGLWGYDAGQSGLGDIFGWFVKAGVPPEYHQAAEAAGLGIHAYLTELASRQENGEHGLIPLDWQAGNRSVLVDLELSGVVVGQTLAAKPEDTYRALLEATAFGTRTFVDASRDSGVSVREFIVVGGPVKDKLMMQIYADVTWLQLSTIGSTQGPAIDAAVAAVKCADIRAAAAAMGPEPGDVHTLIPYNVAAYEELFQEYRTLHDYFGRSSNDVMPRLKAIQRTAASTREMRSAAAVGVPA